MGLETRLLEFAQKHPKRTGVLAVVLLVWGASGSVVISWGGGFAVSQTPPIHYDHHPRDRLNQVTTVHALTTADSIHFSICFELSGNANLTHERGSGAGSYQVLTAVDLDNPTSVVVPRTALWEECSHPEGYSPFPITSNRDVADFPGVSFLRCSSAHVRAEGEIIGCYIDPERDSGGRQPPAISLARVGSHRHTNPDSYILIPLAWIFDLATAPLFVAFLMMFAIGGVPGTP